MEQQSERRQDRSHSHCRARLGTRGLERACRLPVDFAGPVVYPHLPSIYSTARWPRARAVSLRLLLEECLCAPPLPRSWTTDTIGQSPPSICEPGPNTPTSVTATSAPRAYSSGHRTSFSAT
ncbi:hypothetical protein PYCCODRAFT_841366 [Trametes coccinea BRFM310]|uniref:Uncharacterized protein n=1 Tax=Trametes coccinea (strain BRFM310) TaxID=1353009 RepID=A0A1Y2IE20_TRAC3|nr:hypothetical protein PYCCODRAFT_841366 [Trametes coccinea BRFM310]